MKGHRTRCEREIENLLALLAARYSSVSEDRIKERLESLEKHTLRLSDIKDYLVDLKYTKAKDHDHEVQEFLEVCCIIDSALVVPERHARYSSLTLLSLLYTIKSQSYNVTQTERSFLI